MKHHPLWLVWVFLLYSVFCVYILLNYLSEFWTPIFRFTS